ncbi:hypothetical protein [Pseudodesulfovibrio sp.]|uniref:hypothetical protein n=1 Tax=unclassified Pseudodesulfovibrio TaxID=2661612 RepID=UPI003AFF98D8
MVRIRTEGKERPNLFIKFTCDAKDKETKANILDFQRVLGLNPAAEKHLIGFGSMQVNDTTISFQTFPLAQVLSSIAGRMDMPDEDVASHRASPGGFADGGDGIFDRVMVRSSRTKPTNAFAAIRYRDNWFWVDDGDLVAKRVFSFVMLAFTMMDKTEQNPTLQLTLPTQ